MTYKPKTFITSSGFKVLVGRNANENDLLTLKMSRKADLFFHTSDVSGSHVVLIVDQNQSVPRLDISEAAFLAAKHSKSNKKIIKIDYTEISNVFKPKKAPVGEVEITTYKSIKIDTTDEQFLNIRKQLNRS